jgi:uncharacterized coiled-coil DUF342 family protein
MAINIPIVSEFNNAGLKKAQKEFQRLEKTSQKVGFALKKAFVPATAAFGGLAAAAIPAINAASDLEESMSKVGVIFGEGAKEVEAFAETAAKALGQSKQDVLEAAGTFGTFGKAAGLAGTDLAEFSNGMTALASDVASFNNAEPDEVIQAMGAALRGEAEPMRRFGVLLNDATLRAEAMALGIYDGNGALTDQQKILAAQQAILKQTADAQGDFARTSEGLANQTRIMKAQFEDVKAELGKALLPIVLAILPVFSKLADFVGDNTDIVIKLAAAIGGLSAVIIAANIGMKIYTATTAIATAAQWAFNTAVGAIALPIVAVVAFTSALVALERASDKASRTFRILLPGINGISDGISWLQKQTEDVNEEWAAWNQTLDEGRRAAGNMYPEIDETAKSVEDLMQEATEAAGAQLELANSVNQVYEEVRKLNPELVEMLRLLDVQDDIEKLRTEFDNYNEVIAESSGNVRELQQAERDLTRAIIETLSAHGLLTLAFDKQLKIKIDTGDLDAAYASALRVLNAFQQVQQVSAGQRPSTYVPPRDELGFLSAPPVATTTITPVSSITRAPSGAVQNVTVNVNTPTPTEEIGKVVVDSIRKYNRSSGSATIGVLRL